MWVNRSDSVNRSAPLRQESKLYTRDAPGDDFGDDIGHARGDAAGGALGDDNSSPGDRATGARLGGHLQ